MVQLSTSSSWVVLPPCGWCGDLSSSSPLPPTHTIHTLPYYQFTIDTNLRSVGGKQCHPKREEGRPHRPRVELVTPPKECGQKHYLKEEGDEKQHRPPRTGAGSTTHEEEERRERAISAHSRRDAATFLGGAAFPPFLGGAVSLPLLCVGATVLPTSWVVVMFSFCFCFF